MTVAPNDSYWAEAIEQAQTRLEPALDGAHTADVVCVGGGYTSLVTAYLLKKREPSLDIGWDRRDRASPSQSRAGPRRRPHSAVMVTLG